MKMSALLFLSALAVSLALPASAAIVTFTATLGSAGEPVPTSTATGSATVTFDNVANTVGVNVSWSGLLGSGPFGHIHCCTTVAGTGNSGVSLGFATLTDAATGSYVDTFTPGNFATLLNGVSDGKAYVNIHTRGTFGGGEIRGFLLPAATVPEPTALALTLSALGLAAVALKRKAA